MTARRAVWLFALLGFGCSRSDLPLSLEGELAGVGLGPGTDDSSESPPSNAPRPTPPTPSVPAFLPPTAPAAPTDPAPPSLTPTPTSNPPPIDPSPIVPVQPAPTLTPNPPPVGTSDPPPDTCAIDYQIGDVVGSSDEGHTTWSPTRLPASCSNDVMSRSVVFGWSAPQDGCFQFDTEGSDYDTVLHIHRECPDGEELRCNDDAGESFQSRITMWASYGEALALVVGGYSDSDGHFLLNINECRERCDDRNDNDLDGLWDCEDPDCAEESVCIFEICDNGLDDDSDGNVDCADAECWSGACAEDCTNGLDDDGDGATDCDDSACRNWPGCFPCPEPDADLGSATGVVVTASTAGAGRDLEASCVPGTGEELLYAWTPPAAGCYVFSTYGSTFDTVLHIHESCPSFAEIGCNDDDESGTLSSHLRLFVSAETTYLIAVDAYGGVSGTFSLWIEPCP